ncbi:MAG: tRNA pseudouridine(55) synthase TruB [Burkholderiales bacterium]|nr:tRNA pseudouridine(55) synthase TruB [Burkholderiales bacterium]
MTRRFSPLTGVLLLDKPVGISSNAALQRARRLFCADKAGHAGTLDPFASGLLPVAFGEATKLLQYALFADKKYRATLRLGVTTETGDTEGAVIDERDSKDISLIQIQSVFHALQGEQEQLPPMYSALKYQGKPYYEYARQGIVIPRPSRRIHVFSLEWIAFDPPYVTFDAHVSKGTYIRTLAETIGEHLHCGAHLTALRRTQIGTLTIDNAVLFETLEAAADIKPHGGESHAGLNVKPHHGSLSAALLDKLIPITCLIPDLPRLLLSSELEKRFRLGQRLSVCHDGLSEQLSRRSMPHASGEAWVFAVENEHHAIIGIGEIKNDALHPVRVLNQDYAPAFAACASA